MTAREMQMEFERRIQLMNPAFELKEKVTSDTIFSFLNAYTERYVRNNYLQEDAVQDGTRAQKKNADALKGLIIRQTINIEGKDKENTDVTSDRAILPNDYFLYIRSNSVISSCYKGAISKIDMYKSEIELKEQDKEDEKTTHIIKYTYDKTNNVYKYKGKSVNEQGDVVEAETESTITPDELAKKVNVYNHDHMIITPNKTIREDDVEKIVSTYYNKAIVLNPYVVLNTGNKNDYAGSENLGDTKLYINIIHDVYTTIEQLDLVYYRKPKRFDVIGVDNVDVLKECELPENVHMEIVEGAVEMFITEAKYRLAGTSDRRRNNED